MTFNGVDELHFFRTEDSAESLEMLKGAYKQLVSLVRHLNLQKLSPTQFLFGDEYSKVQLPEAVLHDNARLFADRATAEERTWKKGGSVLEIGVARGGHAVSMVRSTLAKQYHGIDINFDQLSQENKDTLSRLGSEVEIKLFQGLSSDILSKLSASNHKYDTIYIDASHWYHFVQQEIDICSTLVDVGGRLVLNDYLEWFVSSMEPCGVKKAVNEFLKDHQDSWCVDYFAVNDCDISLVRIN